MIDTAIARAIHALARPSVEWRCGSYSDAQRIYFANHTSHLDFVVTWSALPPSRRRVVRPIADRLYWEHNTVRRELGHAA